MKKRTYLLFLVVISVAFWQVLFLQNGMKWDFVDAFLPSRYFFSESILNNQFPLWNPYLLYGTPIYADLVSVFNPEFWIVGNMFGYSNITLQFIYLVYVFLAGVSFFYFLKLFNTGHKLSLALSVAYMLSGLSIGNAQHLAFVSGYAILPFVLASYFKFSRQINKSNLVRLSIALFLIIFCGYPGLTIILGYFLLTLFIYYISSNIADKRYLKKSLIYHSVLFAIVILFSTVLILAYWQISPFLSRFGGLPIKLALKHSFSIQSVLSFILPMATGNDAQFFGTDTSMSNGYFGIISLVLFLFSLTKKPQNKEAYLILFFGVFSLLASFGNQFFLRGFLYKFVPFMDMFQYPSIFRAFTIFSFLAFTGINVKVLQFSKADRKRLLILAGTIVFILLALIVYSSSKIEQFSFFIPGKSFVDELFDATKFDNIIFQGAIQIIILSTFILLIWKTRSMQYFATAVLFLFIIDGIISTQLNIHYTVIGKTNPIKFYKYLKSSPKGFPIPNLNPIGENSDKNAQNDFIFMNNNVFPKKVTFDGLVSFKLNGYTYLSDNYPGLLEAIKKEPVVYLSADIRENSLIEDFSANTVFVAGPDFDFLRKQNLFANKTDKLIISDFSPTKIEVKTVTSHPQLLVYQQNIYNGWEVFVDGEKRNLIKSNFAHMAVLVPSGEHTVLFEYTNPGIKWAYLFTILIVLILVAFSVYFFLSRYPEKKKRLIFWGLFLVLIFILSSSVHRYFYQKNRLGLTTLIKEKTEEWKNRYNNDINILLSTQSNELKNLEFADTICYIDEKTNIPELSSFLVNSKTKYFAFAWQGSIVSSEIIELIKSFYPNVIDQKNENNSGYILLINEATKHDYLFFSDFEQEGSGKLKYDNSRIKVDSVSGNRSYFYRSNDEWGFSAEIPVDEEIRPANKISMVVDFLMEEKISEIILVFSVERAGEKQIYEVSKINKFAKYSGKWSRAAFVVDTKNKLQPGDLIKIYFWNIKGTRFEIDNLKIELIK